MPTRCATAVPRFLTEAFRATGALASDGTVRAITELEEFRGGSTGRKALLSVDYDGADLPTDLFVKFSRDFDDAGRDRGRTQMEFEVRFALLSRTPGFPIAVPNCLFADYHGPSGTGLLITDRIPTETAVSSRTTTSAWTTRCLTRSDTIGPCSVPSVDSRARIKAVGLPAELVDHFPVDMKSLSVGERVPYTADQLQRRVDRLAEFAAAQPGLLPANLRSPAFISRLRQEVVRFPDHEHAIWDWLADGFRLCGVVSLERQRGQRVVLAQGRPPRMRADGLGLRRPDERGHGDLGCDVQRGDLAVGQPPRRLLDVFLRSSLRRAGLRSRRR